MIINYKDNITEAERQQENCRYIEKSAINENFGRIGEIENIEIKNAPETKNRFAHVFWSKPALLDFKDARWNIGNQYEFSLALSALSLACLKALGQEVVLYTDTQGEELLKDLGYDKIYTVFDKLNIHNDFWAAGKIVALQNEPLDSCVIDNDLFLYDGDLIKKIAETNVISSHEEATTVYEDLLQFGQTYCPHLKGESDKSSNTGILKVDDMRLKQMFISAYFNGINKFGNPNILKEIKKLGKGAYCIDLLIEQFNFHKLCKPEHTMLLAPEQKDTKGITHLISFEKYLKMPLVLNVLKDKFPDYYNKVITKWQELDFHVVLNGEEFTETAVG